MALSFLESAHWCVNYLLQSIPEALPLPLSYCSYKNDYKDI